MRTSYAAAFITKLLPAPAFHTRTAFVSFDPEVAFGTLLEFGPPYEIMKFFIILTKSIINFVFSASHAHMKDASTS
jgi:hypothetical protein